MNDPNHTHPPTLSNILDSEPFTNPNPGSTKERENGGRKGGSKCGKKGFGARGVASGRVAKMKDKRMRKQSKVKVAGAFKSMKEREGDVSSELDRRDTSKEGHIIIDLTQVCAFRFADSILSDSNKGIQGGQLVTVHQDPGDPGDEGGKGEDNMESGQEALMSQRPELLDPGEMIMKGKAKTQFQFINYDEQQAETRWMEGQGRNRKEECGGREGSTSMLLEGVCTEEETGHGAGDG